MFAHICWILALADRFSSMVTIASTQSFSRSLNASSLVHLATKLLSEPLSVPLLIMETTTLVSSNFWSPNPYTTNQRPVSDDFDSYCKTHDLIDESYKNQDKWVSKSIQSVARMGFFTSGMSTSVRRDLSADFALDRCINEYADSIWNIEPLAVKEEAEVRARTGLEK